MLPTNNLSDFAKFYVPRTRKRLALGKTKKVLSPDEIISKVSRKKNDLIYNDGIREIVDKMRESRINVGDLIQITTSANPDSIRARFEGYGYNSANSFGLVLSNSQEKRAHFSLDAKRYGEVNPHSNAASSQLVIQFEGFEEAIKSDGSGQEHKLPRSMTVQKLYS